MKNVKKRIAEYRANLKSLVEQRNDKVVEMQAIVDKAKTETRAMNDEEMTKFNVLEKEIANIDATIKAEERARDLNLNVVDPKKKEELRAEEAEERAFANYIKGVVEQRADINLTTGDNGAIIPSSIANKIIKKVYDICPIYQLSTRYNVGGTLNIPYYDESTQTITMSYATEFTELESTSGKLKSIELKGFLAGALSKVSKSLINNSQFDIVNFVIGAMADAISKWIEKELLNGTVDKVAGLSTVTQKVDAASSTDLTADELIDVQEEVPDVYQGNAIWIMNKKTRKSIRKLKDNDGNYLLNKDVSAKWGYTLLGKDVYTSDNMSEMAAGKTAIYYGDMSGLAVKLSEDISIEVLREKFATQHAIGVVGWIEIDSKVENAQKISKLVMKAAV
ncbi:phage major capsid protein [Clostridium magnum]|uniref:Phage capsid family protein n=1 Tax=Clostridium magnum DSM 2767 TaxID=1121326 RepID=A0A168E1E5_9CLOT|nr:phage major capsid protein [Clostridium magnum]KZL93550.1 phage capsid family protein [Clostridium magnum DSM 2767]SHI60974.1 phage major capsid protein, HK97 family [Clostridium magnum DSM 2767]